VPDALRADTTNVEENRTFQVTRLGWVVAIVASVIASRIAAGFVAGSIIHDGSAATESLVQTLILMSLYGAIGWRFIVMTMHRRRGTPARVAAVVAVPLAQPANRTTANRTAVSPAPTSRSLAPGARHLALVPPVR
jgi:hypothetical protein